MSHNWLHEDWANERVCVDCGLRIRGTGAPLMPCVPNTRAAGNTGRHASHVETLQAEAYGQITITIGDKFPGELSSAEAVALGVNFNIAPERFERALWDIPTNFSPRMGTLAR